VSSSGTLAALTDMRTMTRGEILKFLAASLLVASCSGRLDVLTSADGGSGNPDGQGGSGATGNGATGGSGASTGAGGSGANGSGTGGSAATTGSGGSGAGGSGSGGSGPTTGVGGSGAGGSETSGSGFTTGTGAGGTGGAGATTGTGAGGSGAGGSGITGGSGGTGAGGSGTGGSSTTGGSGGTGADGGSGTGGTGGSSCIPPTRTDMKITPTDLYVIADSSKSVNCLLGPIGIGCDDSNAPEPGGGSSRLTSLYSALIEVATNLGDRGANIGILFTPRGNPAAPACMDADYETPNAPMSLGADGVIKVLDTQPRNGGSVLSIPLGGALNYLRSYLQSNPGRVVSLATVFDGPSPTTACPSDPVSRGMKMAVLASELSPPVRTSVVGLGTDLVDLHQIASSGRTGTAHLIDVTSSTASIMPEIKSALLTAATPCDFNIPGPPNSFDPTKMNIQLFFSNFGHWRQQYQVGNAAACGLLEGWYFDNPAQPTRVGLCPASCRAIGPHEAPAISFQTGCPTEIRP